ncbi:MAG: CYTH domain-containing protein [Candidatus Aenigmarchaeota archaeon]|nr:CYTH domain-containing protein [Candidatus Aenigmarchaeota archaeon]
MIEFEVRFPLQRNVSKELIRLGLKKKDTYSMADLIFHPRDWPHGKKICPGYFIVRIRLVKGKKPRMEMKEFLDKDSWRETGFEISDPKGAATILSKVLLPLYPIVKQREIWRKGKIEVSVDNVDHLGKYIEIEGKKTEVEKVANSLGFSIESSKRNYGTQLWYLREKGKIKLGQKDIESILRKFI